MQGDLISVMIIPNQKQSYDSVSGAINVVIVMLSLHVI